MTYYNIIKKGKSKTFICLKKKVQVQKIQKVLKKEIFHKLKIKQIYASFKNFKGFGLKNLTFNRRIKPFFYCRLNYTYKHCLQRFDCLGFIKLYNQYE